MGPLDGVRVVDLSSVVMGPVATGLMADLGAEVIKVESPDGDALRTAGFSPEVGMGALFIHANRNKKSVCLNLQSAAGRTAFDALLATADVLATNIRPAAMARLGLSYDDLCASHPRLVYLSMVGYGQDGPYAAYPAYDDLIQGASGLASAFERSGAGPRYVPANLADRSVGIYSFGAVTAALFARERTGLGQLVEVPMFETMASQILGEHLNGHTFHPHVGATGYQRLMNPQRKPFTTADGHVCALVYNDKQWRSFVRLTDLDNSLATDPEFLTLADRQRNVVEVYRLLTIEFAKHPSHYWLDTLRAADIPVGPLHTFDSLEVDPHLVATGYFTTIDDHVLGAVTTTAVPAKFSATPASRSAAMAPRLGEHTRQILAEAGLNQADIDAAIASSHR